MPTYEYECTKCDHEFEVFQSIMAPPLSRCPQCRSKIRRKIGIGGGLLFKGSGFYITDYRSEGYKQAATADKPAETKETKETKASTDKPAPAAKISDAGSKARSKAAAKATAKAAAN
jgi:putative FmdB family regulatory protein